MKCQRLTFGDSLAEGLNIKSFKPFFIIETMWLLELSLRRIRYQNFILSISDSGNP